MQLISVIWLIYKWMKKRRRLIQQNKVTTYHREAAEPSERELDAIQCNNLELHCLFLLIQSSVMFLAFLILRSEQLC